MDISILFNIIPRLLPTFMLGLVAMVGLIILKKSHGDVISGTVKTMAGMLIIFTAVDVLVSVIEPIGILFNQIYTYEAQVRAADWVDFLGLYGVEIVLVMVLGFLINLMIARFTRLKFVFLTGHVMFWNAFMVVGGLADGGRISRLVIILIGSLIQGILSTVLPALIAPFVYRLTGKKDFSIGHSTTILAVISAWIGKLIGDPEQSIEDINLPEGWSFIQSMTVSTSAIMILVYLVMGFAAGLDFVAAIFSGGAVWLWFLWIIMQGILFGAGLTVLLAGVRLMLGEIVPAFRGVAQKIVPDAVPALDCPMLFPFGQNALVIGFPIAMIASLVTLVVFGLAGYPYLLLPLVVAAFFDVGPGAILANATGGVRGVVAASIVGGVLLIVFQALSLPFALNTTAGFINAFGGNDYSIIAILVGGLARLLGY